MAGRDKGQLWQEILCDAERCIECNSCVTACKNENEVPGVNRRRVGPINDGVWGPRSRSRSPACTARMRPCMAVCRSIASTAPTGRGVARQDLCTAAVTAPRTCPFGAPQFRRRALRPRGEMDKCTFCAGGGRICRRRSSRVTRTGWRRQAAACAGMCSPRRCFGGDGDVIADIYRQRVLKRGKGSEVWGWGTAYGKPDQKAAPAGAKS